MIVFSRLSQLEFSLNIRYFFNIRKLLIITNIMFFISLFTWFLLFYFFPQSIFFRRKIASSITVWLTTLAPVFIVTILLLFFLVKVKSQIKNSKTLIILTIISIIFILMYIVQLILPLLLENIECVRSFILRIQNRPFPPFIYFKKCSLRIYHRCLISILICFFTFITFPLLLILLPEHINSKKIIYKHLDNEKLWLFFLDTMAIIPAAIFLIILLCLFPV